ncbi:AMP-binding protein [Yinghuangia sp. ASG 101]|uniref:class I adenylate-forming enzyme family protein n=1 Tax=Yinghuangia sp. ASG 101 TaxID=2896848 RepID=UPI001E2D1C3C|nr:AMP-binding protein [Yinghuangia sp. ASG 101]UGQ11254.1 AMP-binding protein [Yinghuangia sp. ASG 101]
MTTDTQEHERLRGAAHRPAECDEELWRITVGDVLRQSAARFPDRAAVLWPDGPRLGRMTWAELLDAAERAAASFLTNVPPGQPIAVWGANSADWIVAEYGAVLAGTPLVPVNTALTDAEVAYQLRQSGSRLVLAASEHRGSPLLRRAVALTASLPHPCPVLEIDAWRKAPPPAPGRLPEVDPDSPFLIQYTSGTTGTPKGAVLSHLACVNSGRFGMARLGGAGRHEVLCTPLPLHHVGASVCGALAVASVSGTLVLAPSFTAREVLRLVEQSRATVLGLVPTMMTDILACPDLRVRDLTSLRVVEGGGTAVAPELVRRFEGALGAKLNIAYGQSESPYAVSTRPDDPDEHKAETLGRPSPHREVRVVRPGTGETADLGEHGELCIRSPLNMSGYHGMADATARAIDARGWLRTGDICSMDAQGVLRFHGRTREVIIRGGENIYPREVEEVLLGHPAVTDVAVIGTPDDRLGETVAAVVRLRPGLDAGPQELETFAREHLAAFKIPRRWHFADEFPLTASGKVRKHVLRESLLAEQG